MSEIFADLLARTPDAQILNALVEIEPEYVSAYADLIPKIRSLTPAHSDMRIVLSKPKDWDGIVDISGEMAGEEVFFSIEFTSWQEWLGMPYRVRDCDLSESQIVAWCLTEMTWTGWDQEVIAEKYNEIMESVEEIKQTIEDGES